MIQTFDSACVNDPSGDLETAPFDGISATLPEHKKDPVLDVECVTRVLRDADLVELVDLWAALPPAVRAGFLATARAIAGEGR